MRAGRSRAQTRETDVSEPDEPAGDGPDAVDREPISADALLKIGDLARLAGVTPRTVRFYEDLGLLQPDSRSEGGFRLYRAAQLHRLRAVLALKDVGFSLDDIRAYRDLATEGALAFGIMARLKERLVAGKGQLRARIERLEAAMADLERAEYVLGTCHGCDAKKFDAECHDCWKQVSGGALPEALKAVI